jgi:hypothetical protein
MDFKEFVRKEEMDESVRGLAQSLWGITKGVGNTFGGAMTVADEMIAKTMGQGSKGRMSGGARQFGRGLKQVLWADPSAKEKPAPEQQKPATQPAETKPSPKRREQPSQTPPPRQEQPSQNAQAQRSDSTPPGEPTPNKEWQRLATAYDKAKNNGSSEASKRYIQFLMSQADPTYYMYFLKKLAATKRKS